MPDQRDIDALLWWPWTWPLVAGVEALRLTWMVMAAADEVRRG